MADTWSCCRTAPEGTVCGRRDRLDRRRCSITRFGDPVYGSSASGVVLSTSFAEETGPSAAEYVLATGTATSTTVGRDSYVYVLSGGTAISTRVISNGIEEVSAGATASFATVSGGTEFVYSGGTAVSATVKAGGNQDVDGTASGTTVSSGGHENIISATANFTTVNNGGYENVELRRHRQLHHREQRRHRGHVRARLATDTTVFLGGAIDLTSLTYSSRRDGIRRCEDVLSVTVGGNTYTQQLAGIYTERDIS